jgi:MFS superfamily sulfate permease-like transporter
MNGSLAQPSAPAGEAAGRTWPLMRGLAGWRMDAAPGDILAGVTLAAIAVPEQMATARLAGLPAQAGFFAFIAGGLAFAVLGSSRRLSAGADSTIAPIFAASLGASAVVGSPHFAALAAGLAMLTGAIVLLAGVFRMGWIGNLLSIPVTLGFLSGIAVHIVVSQAPAALGLADPGGALPHRIAALIAGSPHANLPCLAIAAGVLLLIAIVHRLSTRIPGPLVAVALASVAAAALHLERHGVARLGAIGGAFPAASLPALEAADYLRLAPLALLVAVVIMVQTATTTRSFPVADESPDPGRDFIGLGAGGVLAAIVGAFPVNASPPRTAIVAESGGRTQLTGLVAVAIVAAVAMWAGGLLGFVPRAALAGVLLFVAGRLVRVGDILAVVRASPAEAALILATAVGIVVLPIEWGVAAGVGLSVLNGLWASVRVRVRPMRRLPGSTVWWPSKLGDEPALASDPTIAVLGFSAPLTFLNADAFAREFLAAVRPGASQIRLAVLEAAGMVEIDFTGAQALARVARTCRQAGVTFAVARLESVAAQNAFARLGLLELVGPARVYESVAEAVGALSSPPP